jgi:hypothetical protein
MTRQPARTDVAFIGDGEPALSGRRLARGRKLVK